MTDIIAIPTANLRFLTTPSTKNLTSGRLPDNSKWQCGPKTGNTFIYGTMADRMTVLTANYEFSITHSHFGHYENIRLID